MKTLRLCVFGVLALGLVGVLFAAKVGAQGELTATPAQLVVAGERGGFETRTLLLRAGGVITGLQVIPLDLVAADGLVVLPESAITPELEADRLEADGTLKVPVGFDLSGVPGGEFGGELLLKYHGGELSVPVTVRVKDPPAGAIALLVVGVALGVGVSVYRARGRPRDEVLVRVGQVRAGLKADPEMVAPFRARIEGYLLEVEAALQEEGWQGAKEAVGSAEGVLLKWRKGRRDDWLEQFEHLSGMEKRLEEGFDPNSPYIRAVKISMKDVARNAPDVEGPHEMGRQVEELTGQINCYLLLMARLETLDNLVIKLPGDKAGEWGLKSLGFRRRLNELSPSDAAAFGTLQGEVEGAVLDVHKLVVELEREKGIISHEEVREVPVVQADLVEPAPSTRPSEEEVKAAGAAARLRLFKWGSYVIVVVLLAWAGFVELYVARPTFGSNPWGDYFALLAWGFGAEASRAAIKEMVSGWGLPGLE